MLNEQTFTKLNQMKLYGLAHALEQQMESNSFDKLTFEERVGMLVDQEWTDRQTSLDAFVTRSRLAPG